MIYFVQPVDGGPIKIGFTRDLDVRRSQLEAHYSQPLALLATMEGGRAEERSIHKQFAHLRLGRTEQFRPGPDLMAFIGRPLLVDPNPDATEAMPANSLVISIKGTAAFRDWLAHAAVSQRLSAVQLIEMALVEYADRHKLGEVPRRTER